ncbi:uncharacterized protein LOC119643138 [Glossina fuscipes]|uniref:Uncharacterized protein LOC119643138 n=1 Tax=Glossina fuscipes TaxID=7396 RepID=A0A9C6DPT6_9MUSC|nr:uncharacterized protein LOC119643138 [Glossina fuscipes]
MNRGGWVADAAGKAAIWSPNFALLDESAQHNGFARARARDIHCYSCYAPPSWMQEEFLYMLDDLVADARNKSLVITAGDFNAWAVEWGSRITNARGRALLEAFAMLPLALMNDGQKHTFRKAGFGSMIDITFVSDSLVPKCKWTLSEGYSGSDHQAIFMEVEARRGRGDIGRTQRGPKWNDTSFDEETFRLTFSSQAINGDTAELLVREVYTAINEACDASMPRRRTCKKGVPCYWWNAEISSARKECLKARSLVQRSRGKPGFDSRVHAYKCLRGDLKKAIRRSKRSRFEALCREADVNPWGTAYKVVLKRLKGHGRPHVTCPVMLSRIVTTLFPHKLPYLVVDFFGREQEPPPVVTTEDVLAAGKRIGDKKAPGQDGSTEGGD